MIFNQFELGRLTSRLYHPINFTIITKVTRQKATKNPKKASTLNGNIINNIQIFVKVITIIYYTQK